MADSELTDLTAATTLSAGDIFYVVRDPAGTPVDRKIAAENLGAGLFYRMVDEDEVTVTTGGNISLNSTSVTGIAMSEITLQGAVAGDVVYYTPSFLVNAVAQIVYFDAYTVDGSGNAINPFGVGLDASGANLAGESGLYCPNGVADELGKSATMRRVLVSGDISSGTVKVRLFYVKPTSTTRTMFVSSKHSFSAFAQLWRPPA